MASSAFSGAASFAASGPLEPIASAAVVRDSGFLSSIHFSLRWRLRRKGNFVEIHTGRGSGLGLSMVQGFAVQSGGGVQIVSSLGEGTNVELWLPRAEGRSTESALFEPGGSVLGPSRARILVCDDDGDVRALVGTFLRDSGYTVWEANNPTLVLQILERERPIDLLLVDYAMPEMSGAAVIDHARTCQPGLKGLLITGYAELLRTGGIPGIPFLPKPFKLGELSERIAVILNGSSSANSSGGGSNALQ